MILKRTPPEQGDDLLEKATMFLMGFKSALEARGAPVSRKEVEGWEIPPPSLSLKKERISIRQCLPTPLLCRRTQKSGALPFLKGLKT